MSTFCSSRWVAKLCRSVWSETRLSIRPAIEHLALGTGDAPPGAQPLEHHRGEHGVAVFAALALLDAQGHARAIDVPDLQRDDFAGAKPGAIGDRESGQMF